MSPRRFKNDAIRSDYSSITQANESDASGWSTRPAVPGKPASSKIMVPRLLPPFDARKKTCHPSVCSAGGTLREFLALVWPCVEYTRSSQYDVIKFLCRYVHLERCIRRSANKRLTFVAVVRTELCFYWSVQVMCKLFGRLFTPPRYDNESTRTPVLASGRTQRETLRRHSEQRVFLQSDKNTPKKEKMMLGRSRQVQRATHTYGRASAGHTKGYRIKKIIIIKHERKQSSTTRERRLCP